MDLKTQLSRQIAFSRATFGPGERTNGVCDHIAKEIEEIKENPDDGKRSSEWVDVTMLALDGFWRCLEAEGVPYDLIPDYVCASLKAKQSKNEQRTWPDWRTSDPNKAIEHDRSKDAKTCQTCGGDCGQC